MLPLLFLGEGWGEVNSRVVGPGAADKSYKSIQTN